ncbi:hypothetical protein [Anaeroselena agilis]|uniref:Galectin n=1 Tax=Anaeroselena agilis TaxID=3063788 RepID=A0ABU3P2D9_9FIRM|nr:hypothetical protein [Selenomonadales bacterium 4137-cl]
MRIAEQIFRAKDRTSQIQTDYDTGHVFQVFVNGRLQDPHTYQRQGQTINMGFDCLVAGDVVQIFYFLP